MKFRAVKTDTKTRKRMGKFFSAEEGYSKDSHCPSPTLIEILREKTGEEMTIKDFEQLDSRTREHWEKA